MLQLTGTVLLRHAGTQSIRPLQVGRGCESEDLPDIWQSKSLLLN
jgi:hypothetical protein